MKTTGARITVGLIWARFKRDMWLLLPRNFFRYVGIELRESHQWQVGVMHVDEFKKTVWERSIFVHYKVPRP